MNTVSDTHVTGAFLPRVTTPRARNGPITWSFALIFALCSSLSAVQPTTTQNITLTAGWNLISIQVGNAPIPVSTFQSSLSSPANLIEIWGYTPTGNPSTPGAWQSYQPLVPSFPSDLASLAQGQGYWVNVSQTTTLQLSGTPWNGSVSLLKGWNLVGFPGVSLGTDEVQEVSAVFGSHFDRIQQVWTWDTSTGGRFSGYDITAVPQLKDLANVQPGHGYWVYSIEDVAISLSPQPYVALPADSDASPPQAETPNPINSVQDLTPATGYYGPTIGSPDPRNKYVGRKVRFRASGSSDIAYDLNANGILDDPYTQDTILFEKTADTVSITIGNGGSGALTWSLENTAPWLYTAPADDRTWPAGVTTRPRAASGTVSSEKDTLLLYADRSGMTPGRKTGSITLWVGGTAFPISLLLDVAPVDGDWRGFATTTRVGGRNITLGEVRLVLNSFSINNNEANGFRAVLNREQSILFPRDVYMDGVFYAANQFKLTTNFEMKAGDRNAPPYDVFPGDDKDRDTNGDGKVDAMNPFPYGIRREVTLLGTRVSPDRLEGTYIESIRGMLPPLSGNNLVTDTNQFLNGAFLTQSQPVFIEGTFVLERQSFTPTQRSVFNESADLGLNIGGSDTTGRSVTLGVTTPITVQGVTLTLNLTFPDPALLQINLISPEGTVYSIHEFGDTTAIPGTISIPGNIFAGENGLGEWTLQLDWDGSTGERGTLAGWGLNIEATSTHEATGRIVKAGVMPVEVIPGASIRLEGGVTTQTFTAAPDGTFTIPDLTENDYTLYISKPGYQTTTYTFFVSENDVQLGDIAITPLAITEPRLTAAPPIGYAGTQPLHVEFTVDLPLGFAGTTIAWDFNGDSVTDQTGPIASLTETFHDYATPGIYTAKVTFSGSGVGAQNTFKTQVIHVHRGVADPLMPADKKQILVTGFVGAFGARTDAAANTPAAAPAGVTDAATATVTYLGPSPVNLASGAVFQESIWDTANLDLDRLPLAPGNAFPGPEDIDLTPSHPALRYVRFNTNSPNPTKYESLQYSGDPLGNVPSGSKAVETANSIGFTPYTIPSGTTKPNRFRIATTLGGAVFSTEASAVGDIKIQPGRTLP
ncbi:MAG: carboxypeptidase regulatory-like domain-containing protein [Roseimicrobium sp.]